LYYNKQINNIRPAAADSLFSGFVSRSGGFGSFRQHIHCLAFSVSQSGGKVLTDRHIGRKYRGIAVVYFYLHRNKHHTTDFPNRRRRLHCTEKIQDGHANLFPLEYISVHPRRAVHENI
jgi:hypothetical protein